MGRLTIPTLPTYTISLPASDKKVSFRPITVREESFLLQVKESSNAEEIFDMIINIIDNCIVKGPSANSMSIIDIEYLFLQIRMKSVSEEVDITYRCRNVVDGKECNGIIETYVDLNDVKVIGKPTIEIPLVFTSGTYYLTFKQPSIKESVYRSEFEYVWNMLHSIQDPNSGILFKNDLEKDEFESFMSTFTQKQIEELKNALSDICSLYYQHSLRCPKCGNVTDVEYKNLVDFFI